MTTTNHGKGKAVLASIEEKDYICWHLDHPNGNTYDVTFHHDDGTWSVDLGMFNRETDEWKFTPLMVRSDRAPYTLFRECGVVKLVGMKTPALKRKVLNDSEEAQQTKDLP